MYKLSRTDQKKAWTDMKLIKRRRGKEGKGKKHRNDGLRMEKVNFKVKTIGIKNKVNLTVY